MNNIGLIGLGVMGKSLALNMMNHGYKVAGYNNVFENTKKIMEMNLENFSGFDNLEDFVASLEKPRKVFLMVPAGKPVDDCIESLKGLLEKDDIVMDGGNSFYEDTNRRNHYLKEFGIKYFGVGVSGGEEGALKGPSIMPSGDEDAYPYVGKILEDIAAKKDGEACCTYIGREGSGHYVKMVHNGIEYADMQLLAETYLLLKYVGKYSNKEIADILDDWNKRDVQSYLVEITSTVLREKDSSSNNDLIDMILDVAGNKGTGRWTSIEALKQEFNASLLTAAYQARIMSNNLLLRSELKNVVRSDETGFDLEKVYQAYELAKSIAFAQGFGLYKDASEKYDWNLNLKGIASIFRAGCIIQAKLLQEIMDAYSDGAGELLLYPSFKNRVINNGNSLKDVVVSGLTYGLPLPVFTSALTYLNQVSFKELGANVIQGQRDFFGAHTYQRVDKEGFEHHDWSKHE